MFIAIFVVVITGGVMSVGPVSVRVTVNVPVPGFPAASVAVQVTVVVPTGNDEPGGGIHVGVNGREYVPVEFVIMSFAGGRS